MKFFFTKFGSYNNLFYFCKEITCKQYKISVYEKDSN